MHLISNLREIYRDRYLPKQVLLLIAKVFQSKINYEFSILFLSHLIYSAKYVSPQERKEYLAQLLNRSYFSVEICQSLWALAQLKHPCHNYGVYQYIEDLILNSNTRSIPEEYKKKYEQLLAANWH